MKTDDTILDFTLLTTIHGVREQWYIICLHIINKEHRYTMYENNDISFAFTLGVREQWYITCLHIINKDTWCMMNDDISLAFTLSFVANMAADMSSDTSGSGGGGVGVRSSSSSLSESLVVIISVRLKPPRSGDKGSSELDLSTRDFLAATQQVALCHGSWGNSEGRISKIYEKKDEIWWLLLWR